MAAFDNVSGGDLVLPDGATIASGAKADIPDAMLANAGVKGWIKSEQLVKAKPQDKPKK